MTTSADLRRLGVFFTGVFLLTVRSHAAVLYVDLNNPAPTAPYSDWSTAATNIQDAIDAASVGDTVMVTNGVYQTGGRVVASGLTNRVVVDKAITVSSVNGPAVTVISGHQDPNITDGYPQTGPQAMRCAYLGAGAILAGFTITNGATFISDSDPINAASGGGVWCQSSSCVLSNCVVVNNACYKYGGGVYQGELANCVLSGNYGDAYGGGVYLATLHNCLLTNNTSLGYGGGAGLSVLTQCSLTNNIAEYGGGGAAASTLTNCSLYQNGCSTAGGGAYMGKLVNCTLEVNYNYYAYAIGGGGAYSATLNNCVLKGNQSLSGGGAYGGVLNNCTLTGNYATNSGGGAVAATLNNCIVYFNTAGTNANFDPACTLNFCCTTPLPASGSNNIAADPKLADSAHISIGSPCRGAGSATYSEGVDVDGEAWAIPPSIGCDEIHPGSVTGPLNVAYTLSYTSVVAGFVVNFADTIQGETTGATWDFGDGTVVNNEPYVSHAWTALGDYPVVLTAFNQTHPAGISATVIVHILPQPVHYVDINSESPVAPYSSWDTAATNIQDAVDAAFVPEALILVNDGRYQFGSRPVADSGITNRLVVAKLLTVQSVNGPTVTSIDGGNVVAGVYLTNGAALTGFTVFDARGGVWSPGGAVVSNCMFIADETGAQYASLTKCYLSGNGVGAAACTLNGCVVSNSNVEGISDSTANNCLIVNNIGSQGSAAIYSILNNCTMAGNVAYVIGGGAYRCTLNNCISYNNWAPSGSNYDGSCTLNYCCTSPLPATGVGNFTNSPAFIDYANGNLRLQTNSPCINAGNNAFVVGSTDLDGNARISGGTVDVGAYEFQNPASIISYAWLDQYGLATDGSADFADSDGDGMNNYQEWHAGTDPTNPLSVLKLVSLSAIAPNVTVSWESVSNRSYYLLRAPNVGVPGSFALVATNIPGASGTTSYTDTNAPSGAQAFYRVGVQ